ncbi:MAG: hypothetical protein Q8N13_10565 [Acidovorax sp.]|nr:hypothetical protein [Acidovorax sp.]
MATPLPAEYRLLQSSTLQEETGVAVDKTDDGANVSRDLYPRSYYDIKAQFGPQRTAQREALMAFLRANRSAEIDITLRGSVYRCRVVQAPSIAYQGGRQEQVSVGLRGYAV